MRGQPGSNTTARLIVSQFPGHECMDDLRTEGSFDTPATWVIGVMVIFTGVRKTRHWQTSGRLVQWLNVCIVLDKYYEILLQRILNKHNILLKRHVIIIYII